MPICLRMATSVTCLHRMVLCNTGCELSMFVTWTRQTIKTCMQQYQAPVPLARVEEHMTGHCALMRCVEHCVLRMSLTKCRCQSRRWQLWLPERLDAAGHDLKWLKEAFCSDLTAASSRDSTAWARRKGSTCTGKNCAALFDVKTSSKLRFSRKRQDGQSFC